MLIKKLLHVFDSFEIMVSENRETTAACHQGNRIFEVEAFETWCA